MDQKFISIYQIFQMKNNYLKMNAIFYGILTFFSYPHFFDAELARIDVELAEMNAELARIDAELTEMNAELTRYRIFSIKNKRLGDLPIEPVVIL